MGTRRRRHSRKPHGSRKWNRFARRWLLTLLKSREREMTLTLILKQRDWKCGWPRLEGQSLRSPTPSQPPPSRGRSERKKCFSSKCNFLDSLQNTADIFSHFAIPEPQRLKPMFTHIRVSHLVCFTVQMLTSIKLHDETAFITYEIRHVAAHRFLTAKCYAKLLTSQMRPQHPFLRRQSFSQLTSDFNRRAFSSRIRRHIKA